MDRKKYYIRNRKSKNASDDGRPKSKSRRRRLSSTRSVKFYIGGEKKFFLKNFCVNVTTVSCVLAVIARRDERGKSCGRRRTATGKRYGNAVAPREKALQRMTLPKLYRRHRHRWQRVRSVRPSCYRAWSGSHDDNDDGSVGTPQRWKHHSVTVI